ncbi:MAG: sulfotransferase [Ectothiorhodospiraceae bacterium]|nr:sulfotransferase [Ectothiorhodospiraceae bacterium]
MAAHRAGALDQAEAAYRRFVELNPSHAGGLHNLALVLHATGRADEALETLGRAVAADPSDRAARLNLGNLLRAAGRFEDAEREYRALLARDPGALDARYALGTVLHEQRDLDGAEACYQAVVDAGRADAGVWNSLGSVALDGGDLAEAETRFRHALALRADHPGAWLNLSTVLKSTDRVDEAIEACRAAVGHHPDLQEGWNNLVVMLLDADRVEEAEETALTAVRRFPRSARAHLNLANALFDRERLDAVITVCRNCLELDPTLVDAWCRLGLALVARGRLAEAADALRRGVETDPNHAAAHNCLGVALLDLGDLGGAQAEFERALELDPDMPEAWLSVSRTKRFTAEDRPTIERVATIADRRRMDTRATAHMHFALAKMHDDLREHERAFAHYKAGNDLMHEVVRFDLDGYRRRMDAIIETFDAGHFARTEGFGRDDPTPVFVFGMPRSGTTLVEQILSSHPQVHGAGELMRVPELSARIGRAVGVAEHYPRSVPALDVATSARLADEELEFLRGIAAPGSTRVTDKLPGNFVHLGLIATLFPRATLVHCARDPMDTCLSNYIQLFAEGHHYSYDLRELGIVYREYRRVMAHWRGVLPLRILDVVYEDLVADPEPLTRALIAHCGLEWDDRCLDHTANRRGVTTASNWQVRQPIYRTAVARWRRYEPWLGPLREALEVGAPTT